MELVFSHADGFAALGEVGEALWSVAKDADVMKRKQPKKTWTPGKPLPKFATAAEEERFWLTHDFDDVMEA